MKLSCVPMAWALYIPSAVLWEAHLLVAASFETLQCEGPVSTEKSNCHMDDDLKDPRETDYQVKGYTFSEPFHLIVSYGPSSSAESPTLNPAPQKLAAPETTSKETPGPLPPLATPSEHRGFSSPDPHLHHQMSILLKLMQDVRALLGHLVIELRDLSGHLKPETTKAPVK
ncbi:Fc receptor like A, transcript variant X5 [Ictidomys tridecemlineatus]|nr:Fc receptor like A, transcript variant X5 [Ictidomys tridecemlineatus]